MCWSLTPTFLDLLFLTTDQENGPKSSCQGSTITKASPWCGVKANLTSCIIECASFDASAPRNGGLMELVLKIGNKTRVLMQQSSDDKSPESLYLLDEYLNPLIWYWLHTSYHPSWCSADSHDALMFNSLSSLLDCAGSRHPQEDSPHYWHLCRPSSP